VVHLTKGGCLGPCALANVASLEFDGQSVFFQSISQPSQVRMIFDYIEAMVCADRFLPPPPELAALTFNYYDWSSRDQLTEDGPASAGIESECEEVDADAGVDRT
jgi:cobaltochelatase CobN